MMIDPRSAAPIVLTAGGTGGHLFPAQALAELLLARGRKVVFVTDDRAAQYGGALAHVDTHRVPSGTPTRQGAAGKALALVRLAQGTLKARSILKRLNPAVVVGFGGYPAAPASLAAGLVGAPLAIHEQNAVLGRVNRLLVNRAAVIATSLPDTVGIGAKAAGKIRLTGNPVRPAILERRDASYVMPTSDGPIHLLVTGGSQGARTFDQTVPAALAALPQPLRARLRVTQQVRPEGLDAARTVYHAAGIEAVLAPFIADMATVLAEAHLAIARAGASTVAELTVLGRPAILAPYPYAADDHQTANARRLTEVGAGWLMPDAEMTTEALTARLTELLTAPETLAEAAGVCRALGRPKAGEALADAVAEMSAAHRVEVG